MQSNRTSEKTALTRRWQLGIIKLLRYIAVNDSLDRLLKLPQYFSGSGEQLKYKIS